MSDIADKLRSSRVWIEAMLCECDSKDDYQCNRCRALAEFPDPDAVQWFVLGGRHLFGCDVDDEIIKGKPCNCGYDAALAKLEEKP